MNLSGTLEWLETNRSGDFALGSVDRKLRRKYHSLLTVREPGRGDAWNVLADVREELCVLAQGEQEEQRAILADVHSGGNAPPDQSSVATLVGFTALPHATHRYRALDLEVERTLRLSDPASLGRGQARADAHNQV